MKVTAAIKALTKKNDTVNKDRLNTSLVRKAIEEQCNIYLKNNQDILEFEALPNALDETVNVLSDYSFQERYEFEQVSNSVFRIKLRDINLLGV